MDIYQRNLSTVETTQDRLQLSCCQQHYHHHDLSKATIDQETVTEEAMDGAHVFDAHDCQEIGENDTQAGENFPDHSSLNQQKEANQTQEDHILPSHEKASHCRTTEKS